MSESKRRRRPELTKIEVPARLYYAILGALFSRADDRDWEGEAGVYGSSKAEFLESMFESVNDGPVSLLDLLDFFDEWFDGDLEAAEAMADEAGEDPEDQARAKARSAMALKVKSLVAQLRDYLIAEDLDVGGNEDWKEDARKKTAEPESVTSRLDRITNELEQFGCRLNDADATWLLGLARQAAGVIKDDPGSEE